MNRRPRIQEREKDLRSPRGLPSRGLPSNNGPGDESIPVTRGLLCHEGIVYSREYTVRWLGVILMYATVDLSPVMLHS
jgi:hypothetical protein